MPLAIIPTMPQKAKGTPQLKGRGEIEISFDEMLAICDAIPNRSRRGNPVKQLATLCATSATRLHTAQRLSVPEHWQPGSEWLHITSDIDKEGVDREYWLSPRTREALESAARGDGPIFGEFAYMKTFRAAARAVIGEERAKHLTLRDFRHGCLSAAEATHGIQAAAWIAGHKSTEMTARRYVLPKHGLGREALEGLANLDRTGHEPGTSENEGASRSAFTAGFVADAKGFEPPTSPSGGDGTNSRKRGYAAFSRAK